MHWIESNQVPIKLLCNLVHPFSLYTNLRRAFDTWDHHHNLDSRTLCFGNSACTKKPTSRNAQWPKYPHIPTTSSSQKAVQQKIPRRKEPQGRAASMEAHLDDYMRRATPPPPRISQEARKPPSNGFESVCSHSKGELYRFHVFRHHILP